MGIIKEILLDSIEAILLLGIFETLYNQKKFIIENKVKSSLFCILYIIANYWSTFYITKLYHTLFLVVFCILVLAYITEINIFTSVVICCTFVTIIFATETFTQIIEMFIFKVNLDQIALTPRYLWILIIVAKILQIFIVVMLFRFNISFSKFKLFKKEGYIFSNFIIKIGVLGLFIFSINFSVFDNKNIHIYTLFIIYLVFLIVELRDLREKEKIININNKYKIQEYQIKNMEEIISIIRKEKHDFANHINVIRGLCLLNKPNTVERINDYVLKISDTLHSSFRYLDIGNDYLDGLLSIKNNYAMKNNIDFKVMINESFSSIKIKEDELISIISNLVDNAFEAVQLKTNAEHKEISITTFEENGSFCIEIANNGDIIPEDIERKIFDKGFSTKTKQSSDHGFGLYITKQLVEKNNGIISLYSIPERTEFLIKFPMEEINK